MILSEPPYRSHFRSRQSRSSAPRHDRHSSSTFFQRIWTSGAGVVSPLLTALLMLLPPCLKAGDLLPVKRQHEEISHPLHIPDTSHSLLRSDTTHSLAAGGALLRHSQSAHQHQITGDETGHTITGACEADEPDAEAIPGVRVITAEEIRLRGVARMDELFSLIDTWSGFTINGQDWSTTSPAQGIYEGTGWSLWIDRHPIPLTTLGWHSVNHLPVSLQEIEKVVILDTPVLYQGIFTGQGLIHIITTRCRKGDRKSTRLNSSHVAISYAVF